jgi:hypothetical protein
MIEILLFALKEENQSLQKRVHKKYSLDRVSLLKSAIKIKKKKKDVIEINRLSILK